MKEPSSAVTVEFDKMKIEDSIAQKWAYEDENSYIKNWNGGQTPDENKDKYMTDIYKNGYRYIGVTDSSFKKEGYGLQLFPNGDKYFGQFSNDNRNEDGIYFWKPRMYSNRIHGEAYFGNWKNNKKDSTGIYLWVDEPINNLEYENANFDAFAGEFEEEKYVRGTYLSKFGDYFCLYHGNFDRDGKKTDENAFFYTSRTNKIFFGKMIKDALVSGFLGSVDLDSDDVKDLIYCNFKEDGSVNQVLETNKLDKDDIEDISKKMSLFKKIMFDGNYFLKIYNKYAKVKYNCDNVLGCFDAFDNKDYYNAMKKLLSRHRRNNIYFYIEENFFGREF